MEVLSSLGCLCGHFVCFICVFGILWGLFGKVLWFYFSPFEIILSLFGKFLGEGVVLSPFGDFLSLSLLNKFFQF